MGGGFSFPMGSVHFSPAPSLRRLPELLPSVQVVADTAPSPAASTELPASSSPEAPHHTVSGFARVRLLYFLEFPPQSLSFQAVLALMIYPARVIKIDCSLRRKGGSLSNLCLKTNWMHFA